MHTLFLFLHITGAISLGGIVIASFVSIFANAENRYRGFIYLLGAGLLIQAFSGSFLELTSAHPALFLSFCSKIFFYLAVVGGTQAVLFVKMAKLDTKMPYLYATYCGGITIAATLITGLFIR